MTTDAIILSLPPMTRSLIVLEGEKSSSFWGYFTPLAQALDPAKAIDDAMSAAAANEMDPTLFPESRGMWPVVRETMRDIMSIFQEAEKQSGISGALDTAVWSLDDDTGAASTGTGFIDTALGWLGKLSTIALPFLTKYLTVKAGSAGTTGTKTTTTTGGGTTTTGGETTQSGAGQQVVVSGGLPDWAPYAMIGGGAVLFLLLANALLRK